MDRRRRGFLAIVGSFGLSGCLDAVDGLDFRSGSDTGDESTAMPESNEPSQATTGQRAKTAESEQRETELPPVESPPEPDFTVGPNGDYDDVQAAHRVSKAGDVIGLESGTFSYDPAEDPGVTFVGAGRDATVLEISDAAVIEPGDSKLASDVGATFYDRDAEFWHLELRATGRSRAPERQFQTENLAATFRFPLIELGYNATLSLYHSRVTNTVSHNRSRASAVKSVDSVFEGGLYVDTAVLGDSIVDQAIKAGTFQVTETTVLGHVILDGNADGTIRDTTCDGVIARAYDGGIEAPSRVRVLESEIRPINAAEYDAGSAIAVASKHESVFEHCEIRGSIQTVGRLSQVGDFISCTFQSDHDVDFYFDGSGGREIYGNAFVDGDLRLDESVRDYRVYSEAAKIGNYYAAFDAKDEDGDGISDLPRPIPGTASLVDRYPLMEPDPDQYR